jgi:hypothetical protein
MESIERALNSCSAGGSSRDGSSLDDLAPLNGIDVLGEADPLNVGFG